MLRRRRSPACEEGAPLVGGATIIEPPIVRLSGECFFEFVFMEEYIVPVDDLTADDATMEKIASEQHES